MIVAVAGSRRIFFTRVCPEVRVRPEVGETLGHYPGLDCSDRRICPISCIDFSQHMLDMLFDGFNADAERLGNFFVAEAKCNVTQYLRFPRG